MDLLSEEVNLNPVFGIEKELVKSSFKIYATDLKLEINILQVPLNVTEMQLKISYA